MKNLLKKWNVFEIAWLGIFSLIAIVLTVVWKDNFFGFSVFLTGILCVVLTAKGSIWSYAFGTFNTLGYAYLAFSNNLFGEMGLNLLFFLPMNLVGFIMWKRNIEKENKLVMRGIKLKGRALVFVICVVGIIFHGLILTLIKTQNTPFIDATTNVLSIVATILTVKRYKEQWLLYIILNIFTILMWSIRMVNGSADGLLMIVMWSAYLINACYGYYNWNKGSKEIEK